MFNYDIIAKLREFIQLEEELKELEKKINFNLPKMSEEDIFSFFKYEVLWQKISENVSEAGINLIKLKNIILELNTGEQLVFWEDTDKVFKDVIPMERRKCHAIDEDYYLLFKEEADNPSEIIKEFRERYVKLWAGS